MIRNAGIHESGHIKTCSQVPSKKSANLEGSSLVGLASGVGVAA